MELNIYNIQVKLDKKYNSIFKENAGKGIYELATIKQLLKENKGEITMFEIDKGSDIFKLPDGIKKHEDWDYFGTGDIFLESYLALEPNQVNDMDLVYKEFVRDYESKNLTDYGYYLNGDRYQSDSYVSANDFELDEEIEQEAQKKSREQLNMFKKKGKSK